MKGRKGPRDKQPELRETESRDERWVRDRGAGWKNGKERERERDTFPSFSHYFPMNKNIVQPHFKDVIF